jgi:hypothetical protein
MLKPNGYDEAKAGGDFTPVELGGHYLIIKQVSERLNKNNQPMIVVLFDFAPNDKQPGYFMEQFKNDIRPDKKWSNQATQYINVYDSDGKTSRAFKTFTTCVEHSNTGFETQWGDNFCNQFKEKKIGGVFGEQMDFYNGEEKKKRVLRWFLSTEKVDDAQIPDMTETAAYKEYKNNAAIANNGGFMSIPDGIEDGELPFN